MFPESLDNSRVVSIHQGPASHCGKTSSSLKDKRLLKVKTHKSEADSPWSKKTQPNTLSPRPWPNICSNAVFRPGWRSHLVHQVAGLALSPATHT